LDQGPDSDEENNRHIADVAQGWKVDKDTMIDYYASRVGHW